MEKTKQTDQLPSRELTAKETKTEKKKDGMESRQNVQTLLDEAMSANADAQEKRLKR